MVPMSEEETQRSLRELAIMNGTYRPEREVANVVCRTCGQTGHVSLVRMHACIRICMCMRSLGAATQINHSLIRKMQITIINCLVCSRLPPPRSTVRRLPGPRAARPARRLGEGCSSRAPFVARTRTPRSTAPAPRQTYVKRSYEERNVSQPRLRACVRACARPPACVPVRRLTMLVLSSYVCEHAAASNYF